MSRRLWPRFLALFGHADEPTAEEDERTTFVPSPLDLSVRISHGGGDDEVVRELSAVHERAEELDAQRRSR